MISLLGICLKKGSRIVMIMMRRMRRRMMIKVKRENIHLGSFTDNNAFFITLNNAAHE